MRKDLVTLVFGGCALMASPLSAGFSATEVTPEATPTVAIEDAPPVRVPVPGLHDQAAMILVGTALIGLAAAVRRAA
jgi:hypothetical protein